MNIKSYILGLGALSMVALSSCDTENVRSIYVNPTAGITFLTAEQQESFSESATDLLFNVDVVRQNSEGEASVKLVSTYMKVNAQGKLEEASWNDDITIPSAITFKDGETMTSFQVSLSDDIQQGIKHYVNVALDTKEAPVDANMSKLLTISRAYIYGELMEKNLSSTWFAEGHTGTPVNKTVKIQQGTQNKMLYRTINVYKSSDADKDNYPMIITLSTDKDGKKVAEVAETQVDANLTASGEGEWDDDKISLTMKFVDTKNKKEYSDLKEVFSR